MYFMSQGGNSRYSLDDLLNGTTPVVEDTDEMEMIEVVFCTASNRKMKAQRPVRPNSTESLLIVGFIFWMDLGFGPTSSPLILLHQETLLFIYLPSERWGDWPHEELIVPLVFLVTYEWASSLAFANLEPSQTGPSAPKDGRFDRSSV